MIALENKRVGLVLSGGGARGFAHIGVLKALHEKGIQPEFVSGASMGSIIGALIANGYSVEEMVAISNEKGNLKMFEMSKPVLSLASHKPVRKILAKLLPETFEELKMPMHISTTNLTTGKNVLFSKGPLYDVLLASSSIPVVFKPIEIDGDLYVDGGLTKNFPAEVLKNECDFLIGSHVNFIDKRVDLKSIKDVSERCFRIAIYNTVREDVKLCDLYINPAEVRKYGTLDFKHIPEIIEIGYHETMKELEEHSINFNR